WVLGTTRCAWRGLGEGRTADNVLALSAVTGAGGALDSVRSTLEQLVRDHLAVIRTELGRFSRQVSGYALEHLLPERGFDVAKALVGTEGTCALTLGATLR